VDHLHEMPGAMRAAVQVAERRGVAVEGRAPGICGLEAAYGAAYDVGGPEVMTYREMIERIASLRGKHPVIFEVPVLPPYLSSLWLHVVTPVKAAVARPLIEGLRTETVARDDRIRQLLPIDLTPFDTAARAALEVPG